MCLSGLMTLTYILTSISLKIPWSNNLYMYTYIDVIALETEISVCILFS